MTEDPFEHLQFLESIINGLRTDRKESEALPFAEQALQLRLQVYGPTHPDTVRACESLILMCNSVAMSFLSQNRPADCYRLLRAAERISHPEFGHMYDEFDPLGLRLRVRAVTLNNFACYFREKSKLHAALLYLDEALHLELAYFARLAQLSQSKPAPNRSSSNSSQHPILEFPASVSSENPQSELWDSSSQPARTASMDSSNAVPPHTSDGESQADSVSLHAEPLRPNPQLASTYLNLAVVLSQLERHDDALRHVAKAAVILLGRDTVVVDAMQAPSAPVSHRDSTNRGGSPSPSTPSFASVMRLNLPEVDQIPPADDPSLVCAALFNLGVELEYAKRLVDAFVAYRLGTRYSEKMLGKEHPLGLQLAGSLGHVGRTLKIPVPKQTTGQFSTTPSLRASSTEMGLAAADRRTSQSSTSSSSFLMASANAPAPAPPSSAGSTGFRRKR